METISQHHILLYWEAAKEIFGARKAEQWLDDNSKHLPTNIKTIEEAKEKIQNVNSSTGSEIIFEEIPQPVGKFIIDQKDIKPMQTQSGNYYHYSDVIALMKRYAKFVNKS